MDLENVIDESGPATQIECPICGSYDYFQEAGFYYCSTCNTQSQLAQLYVEDEYRFLNDAQAAPQRVNVAVLRGKKAKGKKTTDDAVNRYQLSTWEIYNVVLKTMADRLVEVGFPEAIKAKIFHLYVAFLIKRKVIFVSKSNPDARSRITVGEPKTNLYSLYGMKKQKRRKFGPKRRNKILKIKFPIATHKELNEDQDLASNIKRKKTISKRKAMEKDYLATEKATPVVDEREFENMIDEETRRESQGNSSAAKPRRGRGRFLYTPLVRKLIKKRPMKTMISKRAKLLAEASRSQRDLAKLLKFEHFNLSNCFITVFVALRELGFPVVMADIFRLNSCGILEVGDVQKLIKQFDEYQQVNQPGLRYLLSTSLSKKALAYCGEDIESFIEYVGIKKFNYPRIKEIVPKYIDEFVLPREFECLVNLINEMFSFNDYVDDLKNTASLERYRALPEVFVLVQLVVTLKMLFGLDDKTEKFQSSFAKLVNQVIKEQVGKFGFKMEEWTELFVIEDWFSYLQRRREVVKRELCCPAMYTPNNPPSIAKVEELLANCTVDSDDDNQEEDTWTPQQKAAKSCKTLFETIIHEKIEESQESPKLKPYLPLPLPTESVIKQYLERYPHVADPAIKPELLRADFTQKRLDFIWNPKKYTKLLKLKGYKVKIIRGDAINNFPHELEKEIAESKVILVFQPYKCFDEFVGRFRHECSKNMQFVLGLCEDIIPSFSTEKVALKYTEPFLQKLVNAFGDMYIKRVLLELVPVMTRWEESD